MVASHHAVINIFCYHWDTRPDADYQTIKCMSYMRNQLYGFQALILSVVSLEL